MRPPKAGSPPLPESPTNFKGSVPSKVFSVVVHPFISHTTNSCAYERGNQASPNAFVYIGGLTGGPHTANELVGTLLTALSLADLGYSIWEFRMRSSYTGWAHSTLDHDAADIASFIAYLRKLGKERIVLMGSSTGCQDCMRLMEDDPAVYAYIMQGPTSDRLTATTVMAPGEYERSLEYTTEQIAQGNLLGTVPRELVPAFITEPVAIHRWYSLIAPRNEDYFHPDLDERTMNRRFRVISRPTLMLLSEKDEMVPANVDKAALLKRWIQASSLMVDQLSSVVPDADHTLSRVATRYWVADRVVQFLRSVDATQAQNRS